PSHCDPPHLHSFPTRRSSDLRAPHGSGSCTSSGACFPCGTLSLPRRCGQGALGASSTVQLSQTLPLTSSPVGFLPGSGDTFTKIDRKSTRLNSSHVKNSYAVF